MSGQKRRLSALGDTASGGLDRELHKTNRTRRLPELGAESNEKDCKPSSRDNAVTNSHQWARKIHRDFVEAIFQVGIMHASPAIILENMSMRHKSLTSERVKSHLQKFRNSKSKSIKDFMKEYDAWMHKAMAVGAAAAAGGAETRLAAPGRALVEMVGSDNNMLGGDMPAYLTYSVLAEQESASDNASSPHAMAQKLVDQVLSAGAIRQGSQKIAHTFSGIEIPLPALSEAERDSPLGIWFGHTISLLYSMTHHLMQQRLEGATWHADAEKDGSGSKVANKNGLETDCENGGIRQECNSNRSSVSGSSDVADAAAFVAADAADFYYHTSFSSFPSEPEWKKLQNLEDPTKQAERASDRSTRNLSHFESGQECSQNPQQSNYMQLFEHVSQHDQELSLPAQQYPQSQIPPNVRPQFLHWRPDQQQIRSDAHEQFYEWPTGQPFYLSRQAPADASHLVNHRTYPPPHPEVYGDLSQPIASDIFDDDSGSYGDSE